MKRIYHITSIINNIKAHLANRLARLDESTVVAFNTSLLFYYILWHRNGQQNKFNQEYNMIKAKGNFEEVCLLQFIACVRITIGKVIPIYATQKLQHMPQCGENDSHILSKKRYQIYRLKCLLFHFLKTNESERHKEWLSVYYELISFAVLCYQLYTIKWFSTISMTLILSSSIHIKWEENRLSLQIRTNTNIVIITSI